MCICVYLQSVHCAGLLGVQNILSADTAVSPGKLKVIYSVISRLVSQSVLRHRVLYKFLFCSVLYLYDSCESMFNQPALFCVFMTRVSQCPISLRSVHQTENIDNI
jgi:hypothetical protein